MIARRSTAKTSAYDAYDAEEHYGHGDFFPGERIGRPLVGRGRRLMLRGAVVLLIALAGGWVWLDEESTWRGWLQAVSAAVSRAVDLAAPGPVKPTTASVATTALPPIVERPTKPAALDMRPSTSPPPASTDTTTPGAMPSAAPSATATLSPAATGSDAPPVPPYQPPTVDPSDPHQVRAAAVGLHPDLSRVLLARLSPDDYRNAGIAVQKAIAETPDSGVFVWPRQRKPELALFQVRFVPGAAPDCRRYVVSIAKDGWLTTALPMERCGPQAKGTAREGGVRTRNPSP